MRCAEDFSCTMFVDGTCYIIYNFFLKKKACLVLDLRTSASLQGEKICVGDGSG